MLNKNGKLWLAALVVVIVVCAGLVVAKKFPGVTFNPPPQGGTVQVNSDGPKAPYVAPREKLLDVVPITFHVGQAQTFPLPNSDAYDPRVAPDGSRIVFVKASGGKRSIAVAALPGGEITSLDLGLDDVRDPDWSADGSKVVLAGLKKGDWEIYLYDLKEATLRPLTNDPTRKKSWPRFSPYTFDDNYRIAYVSEEGGRKDIWWVRESGHYDQPITVAPEKEETYRNAAYWQELGGTSEVPALVKRGGEAPEWSPSGNLLLYHTAQGPALLAYSYYYWWQEKQAPLPTAAESLSWAPNQISCLSYNVKNGKAAILARDGQKSEAVLKGLPLTSRPGFFPDGQGLVYTLRQGERSVLTISPYNDPLGDVTNLWMYPYSRSQKEKLAKNQLLLLSAKHDQIYDLYDTERYRFGSVSRPYLVTSDAVLETFYAAFAALYAQVERAELAGALEEFARNGAAAAREQQAGPEVENFFLTGLVLLKADIAASSPAEVRGEAARVEAGAGKGISFFDQELDYSDFFIRGKYERDKDLQGYFRAIKWFQAFTFDLTKEPQRKNAAAVLAVASAPRVRPSLERIYALYREMVGESRYYNPLNLTALPPTGPLPAVPPPLPWIVQKEAFWLLPSIYTLDACVFDELVWHTERLESVQERVLPKGLDLMAAFGSTEAKEILLKELQEGRYPNYEKLLAKVTAKVGSLSRNDWDANTYQTWLVALQTLVQEPPPNSPAFTKTSAWKRKGLNTALGSWVNLRYETIAVVEQGAAECGESGYEVLNIGKPRGYVEPNPEFFRRLDDGFGKLAVQLERSIKDPALQKGVRETLASYRQHLKALETIARKELAGTPLSDDEYEEILAIGGTVEHFILLMGSLDGKDEDHALRTPEPIQKIVDVQKAPEGGDRLYEALGFADEINVAVPYFGRRQLVKGAVYSYYEFTSGASLDSEKWRKMDKPARPVWIKDYYEGVSNDWVSTLPDLKLDQ